MGIGMDVSRGKYGVCVNAVRMGMGEGKRDCGGGKRREGCVTCERRREGKKEGERTRESKNVRPIYIYIYT